MDVAQTQEAMRASDLFSQILSKALNLHIVNELSNDQVSVPQALAMRYLWLHDHVMMGDLAAGLGISYPSATNMVKRLEKRGLAQRRINPVDRRAVEVQLTQQGRALAERMERERVERLAEVLSSMPADDRDGLLRGLRAFVQTAVVTQSGLAEEICLRCGALQSDQCPVMECLHKHGRP
ncbi:MAG: MarR family transcriptional regulator [Chthonomonadales bacterium]|nr:MarR family transcriptional regulator [Chthonomonadales bacterium]